MPPTAPRGGWDRVPGDERDNVDYELINAAPFRQIRAEYLASGDPVGQVVARECHEVIEDCLRRALSRLRRDDRLAFWFEWRAARAAWYRSETAGEPAEVRESDFRERLYQKGVCYEIQFPSQRTRI
jgi:hypothetical protein